MTALQRDTPKPTEIRLRTASRILDIDFADGRHFELSCEFLRVHSPSAEVRGHGPGQEILQLGKQNVEITQVEPVGVYGVQQSYFSDGHDTGIYSWQYLYELGTNRDTLWARYLERVQAEGGEAPQPGGHTCGSGCGH